MCGRRGAPRHSGRLPSRIGGSARADAWDDWLHQSTLTGDWRGLRTSLDEQGIMLRAHYLSETAANPTGGLEQGIKYDGSARPHPPAEGVMELSVAVAITRVSLPRSLGMRPTSFLEFVLSAMVVLMVLVWLAPVR
jgi:hypothetical protein